MGDIKLKKSNVSFLGNLIPMRDNQKINKDCYLQIIIKYDIIRPSHKG